MTDHSAVPRRIVRLSDRSNRTDGPIEFEPDAAGRAAIAEALGLIRLRKLALTGTLRPVGRRDWVLEATLGATAVQACVVTLEPVQTRIDEPVARRYLADWSEPDEAETEMPEDDTAEPLRETIDLAAIAIEALSLALPAYPRADGADPVDLAVTEPGKAPMSDDDAKPFAGLDGLLKRGDGDDGAR